MGVQLPDVEMNRFVMTDVVKSIMFGVAEIFLDGFHTYFVHAS